MSNRMPVSTCSGWYVIAKHDHDDDGFSELGKINSTTLGFKTYYKPTHFSKLTLEYHHIKEFRRGGNNLDRPPHEADVAEQADHNIHGGSLNYSLVEGLQTPPERVLFHPEHRTGILLRCRTGHERLRENQRLHGCGRSPVLLDFDNFLFMPSSLTAGVEYSLQQTERPHARLPQEINQEVSVYSAYLQNEWKTGRFRLSIRGRLDKTRNRRSHIQSSLEHSL